MAKERSGLGLENLRSERTVSPDMVAELSRFLFPNYVNCIGMTAVHGYVADRFGPDHIATSIGNEEAELLDANWAAALTYAAMKTPTFEHNVKPNVVELTFSPTNPDFLRGAFPDSRNRGDPDTIFVQDGISHAVRVQPRFNPSGLQQVLLKEQLADDYASYQFSQYGWFGVRSDSDCYNNEVPAAFPLIKNDLKPDTGRKHAQVYDDESSVRNAKSRIFDPALSTITSIDFCISEAESTDFEPKSMTFTVPNPRLAVMGTAPADFNNSLIAALSGTGKAIGKRISFGPRKADAKRLLKTLEQRVLEHPGGAADIQAMVEEERCYDRWSSSPENELTFMSKLDLSAGVAAITGILTNLLDKGLYGNLVKRVVDSNEKNQELLTLLHK